MSAHPLARAVLTSLAVLVLAMAAAEAAELPGAVVTVSGTDVRIRVEGELLPNIGDVAVLSFIIPGGTALRVGTWRITRVDGDTFTAAQIEATGVPTVDQRATITSASPRRRAAAGAPPAPARADPSPGGAAPPRGAPGPTAPSLDLDLTQRQLPSGRLAIGAGYTELSAGRFVITSSVDLTTWYALGIAPTHAYRLSTRLAVTRGLGQDMVGGLQLTAAARADLEPGDVVFGKIASGLVLARFDGPDRWTPLPLDPGAPAVRPEDPDLFEVEVRGGRYAFRVNGRLVATWERGTARSEWVLIHAGKGSRVELRDWRVEQLGTR
jgi:hypothetical protein